MIRRWLIIIPTLALGLLPFQNCGPAPTASNLHDESGLSKTSLWSSVITSQELPAEACHRLGLGVASEGLCFSENRQGQYLRPDPNGSGELYCFAHADEAAFTPDKKVTAYLCR